MLNAVIERFVNSRLVYGETDCLQLCAAAVAAQCGCDHRLQFPEYHSKDEAEEILKAHGGLRSLIEGKLGAGLPGHMAQRGDIVLLRIGGDCAGVCLGSTAVTISPLGSISARRSHFLWCWRPA